MSPFRCPSLFSILSFLEYEHGVWHPLGGCSAITEAMARVSRRLGVEICLNEDVEQIDFEGRRARAVHTRGGSEYRADALVINADFARAMQRLVPDRLRRRWTNRKIESKKFSCSTFMLYLGIEGRYDQPHHTIHIAKDYAKNLDEIENQHVLSSDPSLYVQNACVTDAGLAPAGHSTLYVLVPVPHRHAQIDWAVEGASFRKRVLRQMEEAGFRGIEERIRYEKIISPADWETDYEIHRGATFNLAHTLGQMLHLRPHNRFEDVDGVYLVGGGTHPGSGLPVIFEGARISALKLLNDLAAGSGSPTPRHPSQAAITPSQLTPHEECMAAFSAGSNTSSSR
jgi:phytoene desaturase